MTTSLRIAYRVDCWPATKHEDAVKQKLDKLGALSAIDKSAASTSLPMDA